MALGLKLGLYGGLQAGMLGIEGQRPLSAKTPDETNDAPAPLFAAARRDAEGAYSAALFNLEGDLVSVPLPGRGHDLAVRPRISDIGHNLKAGHTSEVIVFARRPGRFAISFTYPPAGAQAQAPHAFYTKADRHFYGHGVFSPNGRLLFTSENDFEAGVGVIGVRDADKGYQQIGEFSSYGVGPHDLALLSDGRTLVVANGGLETSPDSGRQILNLSEMEPSLVYIDSQTGDLVEKQILPKSLHQLSIRHLSVAAGDRVAFGCQYKGAMSDQPALVGFHDRGSELKLYNAPDEVQSGLKNYIGSVAVDGSGELIAASAPRGNMITFWRARDGEFLGVERLADGCGVARGAGGEHAFLMTSGLGDIALGIPAVLHDTKKSETATGLNSLRTAFQWDNHALRVR